MNDVTPAVSKEEQNWAMLCHLSALIGFLIPFGSILGPLVIWIIKRADMPLVDQHGKEALNFQLTVTILALVSWALMVVLIGFVLMAVVVVGALFFVVRAAIKVSNGELGYRYPYAIRFLK